MPKQFKMFIDTYHGRFWNEGAPESDTFYSRKLAVLHGTAVPVKVVADSQEDANGMVKKFLLYHKGEKGTTPSILIGNNQDCNIIALETPSDVLKSGITEARSVLAGTR